MYLYSRGTQREEMYIKAIRLVSRLSLIRLPNSMRFFNSKQFFMIMQCMLYLIAKLII